MAMVSYTFDFARQPERDSCDGDEDPLLGKPHGLPRRASARRLPKFDPRGHLDGRETG